MTSHYSGSCLADATFSWRTRVQPVYGFVIINHVVEDNTHIVIEISAELYGGKIVARQTVLLNHIHRAEQQETASMARRRRNARLLLVSEPWAMAVQSADGNASRFLSV